MRQLEFQKTHWQHRHNHGGQLRQKRAGRKSRPLSTRQPIHLVFKANKEILRGGFRTRRRFMLIHFILKKYAKHFWIRIDQFSIQFDHIHLIVRAPRRGKYLDFFRVVAGQVAQRFEKEGLLGLSPTSVAVVVTDTPRSSKEAHTGKKELVVRLWKYRPFSRVVVGYKAYQRVRDYVLLNELEALGKIPYRKERLRGISSVEWALLQAAVVI